MKKCSKCKEEKPLEDFNKNKRSKDGRQSSCKECKREQNKQWYENSKEKIREQKKRYRENNKEKILERKKRYRENNKEKIRECDKRYYENNRKKIILNRSVPSICEV